LKKKKNIFSKFLLLHVDNYSVQGYYAATCPADTLGQ